VTQRRPVRRCRADETTTLHGADTRPGERERAPAGTIRTEWIAQELGPGSAHLNLLQGVWHRALLLVSSSAGEILGHTAAHGARTTVRARPNCGAKTRAAGWPGWPGAPVSPHTTATTAVDWVGLHTNPIFGCSSAQSVDRRDHVTGELLAFSSLQH